MATKVLLSPTPELGNPEAFRKQPVLLAKEVGGVFAKEAGGLYCGQYVQVIIGNLLILLLFLGPRIDQMASRPEFAVKTARPRWIFSANLELAGAFHQAVGHPALEGRIVVVEGTGCEVEGIPIRDAVTRIDFAATGDDREEH